jgi:hypothetical protein
MMGWDDGKSMGVREVPDSMWEQFQAEFFARRAMKGYKVGV